MKRGVNEGATTEHRCAKSRFPVPTTRAFSSMRHDGHEFPVDVSLRPVLFEDRLLVIGAVRDMSELRRIEREQAQHSCLQDELLDLTHDAILVRDSLSRVTYWNKGAQALYGWNTQEALGRITHHLLHTRFPVDLASVEVALQRRFSGTVIADERNHLPGVDFKVDVAECTDRTEVFTDSAHL